MSAGGPGLQPLKWWSSSCTTQAFLHETVEHEDNRVLHKGTRAQCHLDLPDKFPRSFWLIPPWMAGILLPALSAEYPSLTRSDNLQLLIYHSEENSPGALELYLM